MRETLFDNGWRQGALIADADRASLEKVVGASLEEGSVCIVVSQSCDILCDDIELEPVFEFIKGIWIPQPEPLKVACRNPRELHLPAITPSGVKYIKLRIIDRKFADRLWLLTARADQQTCLGEDTLRNLVHWMAGRYQRPALPDAFNERVNARRKKISEELDKAPELSGLYVALDPFDEADEETPYQVALLGLTVDPDFRSPNTRQRLENALDKIARRLGQCSNVKVVAVDLRSEKDVSVADIKRYRRFDFDFLSLRSPGVHIQPDTNLR